MPFRQSNKLGGPDGTLVAPKVWWRRTAYHPTLPFDGVLSNDAFGAKNEPATAGEGGPDKPTGQLAR